MGLRPPPSEPTAEAINQDHDQQCTLDPARRAAAAGTRGTGLVDLRALAPRPAPDRIAVGVGVGSHPQQHQRGRLGGADRIPHLRGTRRSGCLAVEIEHAESERALLQRKRE